MKRENFRNKLQKIGNWKFIDELKIDYSSELSIPISEQECHLNLDRENNICYVCCSCQKTLTKMKKNPLFTIVSILLSESPSAGDLKILEVKGTLPLKAVSFRSKLSSVANLNENKEGLGVSL